MALSPQYSDASVDAMAAALATLLNTGYLRIYDGSQPPTCDTAITDQVLLAELRFSATAFGAPTSGVVIANSITADAAANATGEASWARCLKSDGTTAVMDGSVGTSDANVILASTAIALGGAVSVDALTIAVAKGGELVEV